MKKIFLISNFFIVFIALLSVTLSNEAYAKRTCKLVCNEEGSECNQVCTGSPKPACSCILKCVKDKGGPGEECTQICKPAGCNDELGGWSNNSLPPIDSYGGKTKPKGLKKPFINPQLINPGTDNYGEKLKPKGLKKPFINPQLINPGTDNYGKNQRPKNLKKPLVNPQVIN